MHSGWSAQRPRGQRLRQASSIAAQGQLLRSVVCAAYNKVKCRQRSLQATILIAAATTTPADDKPSYSCTTVDLSASAHLLLCAHTVRAITKRPCSLCSLPPLPPRSSLCIVLLTVGAMSKFFGRYASLILSRPQPVAPIPQPMEVPDSVHFLNKVLSIGREAASATLHTAPHNNDVPHATRWK